MPDWTAFGAVSVVLTALVLLLAHLTQRTLGTEESPLESFSTTALLANVAGTQLCFLLVLLGAVWYTAVPLRSLGLTAPTPGGVALGAVLGVALFGLNQVAAGVGRRADRSEDAAANRAGVAGDERLRAALAPTSVPGWLALLLVVLPVIAGFEELLFRGALVGGLAAGFGLSPWLLVAGSSLAFGLGHGAQGRVGVVVTALLGAVLGAAFVVTGSLTVVVVAHYLVNALEFLVWEGIYGS